MKRFFAFLHQEISGIHEAAYVLGFFAFLSQVLALIRDRMLAYSFGASHTLDIYYASFRIPDFLFVSIASIVSLSVLIPFFVENLDVSKEKARHFFDNVFSAFFFVMVVSACILYFYIPKITIFLFPSFSVGDSFNNIVSLSRILLLSPLLLGISNLFATITNVYNRFFIYAISPLLYNVGIIIGVLWLYPLYGIKGLGMGVVLGALLHMAIQIPFIIQSGFFPRITLRISLSSLRKVALLSLPRTLTMSAQEITRLVLISYASLLAGGSISIFTFAFNLQAVPLSIIGVSYSLAIFPVLSKLFSSGKQKDYVEKIIVCAQHIIFLSLPLSALFIVLRAQIVRTVLGAGQFDWGDTRLTAAALAIFVVSLVPQSLILLFVRAFYATGRTMLPFVLNTISALLTICMGYIFTKYLFVIPSTQYFLESLFKVEFVAGTHILALPLAFTCGTFINVVLHWFCFSSLYGEFHKPVFKTFFQSFISSVVIGFVAYESLQFFSPLLNVTTFIGIFLQGLLSGLIGCLVGVGLLYVLKSRELMEIVRTLHAKIWKTQVIGPDPEVL